MVGGDEWAFEFMLPALETLAPSGEWVSEGWERRARATS